MCGALVLTHAAPYAVALRNGDGMVQALLAHRAPGADGAGAAFARLAL